MHTCVYQVTPVLSPPGNCNVWCNGIAMQEMAFRNMTLEATTCTAAHKGSIGWAGTRNLNGGFHSPPKECDFLR